MSEISNFPVDFVDCLTELGFGDWNDLGDMLIVHSPDRSFHIIAQSMPTLHPDLLEVKLYMSSYYGYDQGACEIMAQDHGNRLLAMLCAVDFAPAVALHRQRMLTILSQS